jgi:hypothetical protein
LSRKQIRLLKQAVALAKANPHCRRVEDADYAPVDEMTHTRRPAPYYVVCVVDNPVVADGSGDGYANYFFSEQQIEESVARPYSTLGDVARSKEQEKGITGRLQHVATDRCWDYIRQQASLPDSIENQHWYKPPSSQTWHDIDGHVGVTVFIHFEAMNSLGAKLPHTARCELRENGEFKGQISR